MTIELSRRVKSGIERMVMIQNAFKLNFLLTLDPSGGTREVEFLCVHGERDSKFLS